MDEQYNAPNRPANRRRNRRTPAQIFKEDQLPVIITGLTLLIILVFMIGAISRGIQGLQYKKQLENEAIAASQEAQAQMDAEADAILSQVSVLMAHFDYQAAIDLIDGFSGDIANYPALSEKRAACESAASQLVLWDNPADILSLSFQVLIADPQRAFTDPSYGASYNRNFITTDEFQKILQQLYENDYILISLDHISNGKQILPIYLPEGKKPLLLTQTNVNYYRYMVDSNSDMLPDKNGAGFASRLILDANGNITCEMVDANGETITGSFDMVPILESFIETHPDFSYKGAKAILAVTGYDGIFGYRISSSARAAMGEAHYTKEVSAATAVVEKLRALGYNLACYTYENEPYGSYSAAQVSADLEKWDNEITPILGKTDIFVFSRDSDVANPSMPYNDSRFDLIYSYGFTRYLGFCDADQSWYYSNEGYFRIGRILVTGSTLAHHGLWFDGIIDPGTVLDPERGDIPA